MQWAIRKIPKTWRRSTPAILMVTARGALLLLATTLLVAPPASALTHIASDPSDAPSGAQGKTDLRFLTWDVGNSTTTLTVGVDESVDENEQKAALGVHVLLDTDLDGLADDEVVGVRNADGVKMDITLRSLNQINSTSDCQELGGNSIGGHTVATTIADNLETFSFTFDSADIPDGLTHFRWAAFGQTPPGSSGPWDYLPDAANPDPDAPNPGPRSCGGDNGGLRLTMADGIDLDTESEPTCFGKTATIVGTSGDDQIEGTEGADVLVGLGGSDTIRGFGGKDRICGGGSRDRLLSGGGDDQVNGGSGNEFGKFAIEGGGGDDLLLGGVGTDSILGGRGSDRIEGGGGDDKGNLQASNQGLRGGPGADKIFGNDGGDLLVSRDGVAGNDLMDEGSGTGRCDGDKGDTIRDCENTTTH